MEAVAVTCCELGDTFFLGQRPAPEEVTLLWEEFVGIGSKLASQHTEIERLRDKLGSAEDAFDHEITRRERAESKMARARAALEIPRQMIRGEPNTASTRDMQSLGDMIDAVITILGD
jgi:hypothetical protein